jgi:hypothetical protein
VGEQRRDEPASVSTNAITSTGAISGAGSIGGNATAASTITGVTVAGTSYTNTVSPTPPTQVFPRISYAGSDKTGYTIHTYSGAGACTSARTFVESTLGGLSGNHIVYITGATPCTYTNSNNSTVNIPGNLMIITDWDRHLERVDVGRGNGERSALPGDWRADGNATLAHDGCGSGLRARASRPGTTPTSTRTLRRSSTRRAP